MKTNYVDIICKYLTWYKGVHVEIDTEILAGQSLLRVCDDILGTFFIIYKMEDITKVFKELGQWRLSYLGAINK